MEDQIKKAIARETVLAMEFCCKNLYQNTDYHYRSEVFSNFWYSNQFSDYFRNNLKFVTSLSSIDKSNSNYQNFIHRALNRTIDHQFKEVKKALMLNPNKSFELKLNEDLDSYTLDSFIEENIATAIICSLNYHSTFKTFDTLKTTILYAIKNNIYKKSKPFIEHVKNNKSFCLKENINDEFIQAKYGMLFPVLNKDYSFLFKAIFGKTYYNSRSLSFENDDEFLKDIYECLSYEDKELFIFLSRKKDLVSAGIVSDAKIIESTYKRFKEVLFTEDEDIQYFLSKYYPEEFNKNLKLMMVTKDREGCKKAIIIASKFSGITEKIARYIRSESSEKRAFSIFNSISSNLLLQENIKSIVTQFADTKHDRLLAKVISIVPDNLLYLFISNKLVRTKYTYSNDSYVRRSK